VSHPNKGGSPQHSAIVKLSWLAKCERRYYIFKLKAAVSHPDGVTHRKKLIFAK